MIAATAYCAGEIRKAVELIHACTHRRILLVGIANEADDPPISIVGVGPGTVNIRVALQNFNWRSERSPPAIHAWPFDDLAWFESRWGTRDASGKPAYKTSRLVRRFASRTLRGTPNNLLLGDHHLDGRNALWTQALVA